jgi:hypothetical protein
MPGNAYFNRRMTLCLRPGGELDAAGRNRSRKLIHVGSQQAGPKIAAMLSVGGKSSQVERYRCVIIWPPKQRIARGVFWGVRSQEVPITRRKMIAISITQCVELHFSDELGCFFERDYLGVVLRQVRAKNQRTFQNSPLGFEQSRHS